MNNWQKQKELAAKVNKNRLEYVIQLATEPSKDFYDRTEKILNSQIRNELLLARLNKDIKEVNIENI